MSFVVCVTMTITLCDYGTPPSILKKTAGVRGSRSKQSEVPYVWFPLSIEADSKLPGKK